MKINFIGDVHGRFNALTSLIEKMPKSDETIFIGDIIDRGKNNVEVIDYIMENNYKVILGNHDLLYLYHKDHQHKLFELLSEDDMSALSNAYDVNGFDFSDEIIAKKNENADEFKSKFIDFVKSLPTQIVTEDLYITHAPFIKKYGEIKLPIGLKELMFNKEVLNSTVEYFNIFGHTGKEGYFKNVNGKMIKEELFMKHTYEKGDAICIDGMSNYLIGISVDTDTKEVVVKAVNGNREWAKRFQKDYSKSPKELKEIDDYIKKLDKKKLFTKKDD